MKLALFGVAALVIAAADADARTQVDLQTARFVTRNLDVRRFHDSEPAPGEREGAIHVSVALQATELDPVTGVFVPPTLHGAYRFQPAAGNESYQPRAWSTHYFDPAVFAPSFAIRSLDAVTGATLADVVVPVRRNCGDRHATPALPNGEVLVSIAIALDEPVVLDGAGQPTTADLVEHVEFEVVYPSFWLECEGTDVGVGQDGQMVLVRAGDHGDALSVVLENVSHHLATLDAAGDPSDTLAIEFSSGQAAVALDVRGVSPGPAQFSIAVGSAAPTGLAVDVRVTAELLGEETWALELGGSLAARAEIGAASPHEPPSVTATYDWGSYCKPARVGNFGGKATHTICGACSTTPNQPASCVHIPGQGYYQYTPASCHSTLNLWKACHWDGFLTGHAEAYNPGAPFPLACGGVGVSVGGQGGPEISGQLQFNKICCVLIKSTDLIPYSIKQCKTISP